MEKIFGNEMDNPDIRQEAEESSAEKRKVGLEKIEGELEKTLEQQEAIHKTNVYIQEEFVHLNILDFNPVEPERYHYLPKDIYENSNHPDTEGSSLQGLRAIDINYDTINGAFLPRLKELHILIHESLHLHSSLSHFVTTRKRTYNNQLYEFTNTIQNTSGYRAIKPGKSKDSHIHFNGLNEAVIDTLTLEIINNHTSEIKKEFAISNEEWQKFNDDNTEGYLVERKILNIIIKKIAEKDNVPEEEVWSTIKKGLFTGEMMHLRLIEKTYGKGSLRVLSALSEGAKDYTELSGNEIKEKFLEYFLADDETERNKIALFILNERERLRYQKRRE